MEIGKRIIELREKKNISTNKLANLSGISQSYLREIEMEQKNPTVEMVSYICDALGISLVDFFNESLTKTEPFLISAINKLNSNEQLKLAEFINIIKK